MLGILLEKALLEDKDELYLSIEDYRNLLRKFRDAFSYFPDRNGAFIYTQYGKISIFSTPLISNGNFIITRNGMIRKTQNIKDLEGFSCKCGTKIDKIHLYWCPAKC